MVSNFWVSVVSIVCVGASSSYCKAFVVDRVVEEVEEKEDEGEKEE